MAEPDDPLSERELEILRLVATGAANKQIAQQLVISPNTVKVHLRNIFAKIGVSSRTEATLYAMNIGLVKTTPPLEVTAEHSTQSGLDVVEESKNGGGRLAAPPAPVWKLWQIGLAILAGLLLVTAVTAGLLLVNPARPEETARAQATLSASSGSRWTNMANLPSPRRGMGSVEYENAFYIIGGQTAQGVDGTTLRYRIDEDTWEAVASKPTAVTEVQAALVGEKIYVPGGCLPDGSATSVLEVFDPRQDTWEKKAPLPEPVCAYALASYEGQLYLFGGKRSGEYLSDIYVYDPQENSWEERLPLSAPRAYAGAVAVSGKILLIGGFDGQQALTLNEAYFPNREVAGEKAWETYAPLPEGRYAMGITQLAGLVYLVGGAGDGGAIPKQQALQYLAQSDEWSAFETLPEPAGAFPAVLASGNYLHTLGGGDKTGMSAVHQVYQAIYTISVPYISGDE